MLALPAKRFLVLLLAIAVMFSFTSLAFAQDNGEDTDTEVVEEEVTAEDLGVPRPGILPTNPFYFFKEFSRGVRRFFTFNPVERAQLELDILNEKAAELDVVERLNPEDSEAIGRAIDNYNQNVERLRLQIESLSDTENPNVERLLDMLRDRAMRHRELFDELEVKHEEFRGRLESSKGSLDEIAHPIFSNVNSCEELKDRLNEVIGEGDDASRIVSIALRMVERFNRLGDDPSYQECLNELREEFGEYLPDRQSADDDGRDEGEEEHQNDLDRDDEGLIPDFIHRDGRTEINKSDIRPLPIGDFVNCVQIFDPVCGKDGKTYSNACFARVAGVSVDYRGKCRDFSSRDSAGSTSGQDGSADAEISDD